MDRCTSLLFLCVDKGKLKISQIPKKLKITYNASYYILLNSDRYQK